MNDEKTNRTFLFALIIVSAFLLVIYFIYRNYLPSVPAAYVDCSRI